MDQRTPPDQILDYINQLKMSYSDLRKVYIFGSFVKGSSRKDSDIDMAMVFDEVKDTFDRQVKLMKVRRKYDLRIEPHVFRVADFNESHPLAAEMVRIITHGTHGRTRKEKNLGPGIRLPCLPWANPFVSICVICGQNFIHEFHK